jgi:Ca2+-binding RTX toxin-like protein
MANDKGFTLWFTGLSGRVRPLIRGSKTGIRASLLGIVAALTLAAQAGAVTLQPGDLLVVDVGVPGVTLVDPVTGQQTPVTNPTINTGTDLLFGPVDLALDPNGDILIADYDSVGVGNNGAIIRVDPATGQQSFVSNDTINTGTDLFQDPYGVAVAANGDIIVSDGESQGVTNHGAIIRVDPATGQQTAISNDTINTAPDVMENPDEVDFDAQGRIVVAQFFPASVLRIDPNTGQQTLVSDNTINMGADYFFSPNAVDVLPNGQVLVADNGSEAIISVDPVTGQQTLVSDNTINTGTDLFGGGVFGVTHEADGRILATDRNSSTTTGAVIAISATGQQSVVSNNDVNTGTDLFVAPDSTVVVPEPATVPPGRCRGISATITGTAAGDTLSGTPARDVIAALAGNDVVKGLAGNDLLCGGKGRDRLLGGKGRDKLFGGKGRDRLRGGPGRDKLRGGPGRDRQVQ